MIHRIYFSPGMFGFGRLASYDYFVHLERSLASRLRARGDDVETYAVRVAPTASIRRRAVKLAELIASTCGDGGPIHLVGHSTGGLDARLVASPSASLAVGASSLGWRRRLASVTTINSPHFGTPLASFFTTVSGARALRALSALTVVGLSLGSAPLSLIGTLVAAFGRADQALGLRLALLDRLTDAFVRTLDEVRSRDVREYIDAIKGDQGAMVQLMPEAMDLFAAGIEDSPGVLCQSTVSMAPPPGPRMFIRSIPHPWRAFSGSVFAVLYGISSRFDPRYPCTGPGTTEGEEILARTFGRSPGVIENDGVVPIRSQVWGKLVWAGYGDHLDVLGHFDDSAAPALPPPPVGPPRHVDWLYSGSNFDRARFDSLSDAIAGGLVAGAAGLR
jgi:triacylglycerol lipase